MSDWLGYEVELTQPTQGIRRGTIGTVVGQTDNVTTPTYTIEVPDPDTSGNDKRRIRVPQGHVRLA